MLTLVVVIAVSAVDALSVVGITFVEAVAGDNEVVELQWIRVTILGIDAVAIEALPTKTVVVRIVGIVVVAFAGVGHRCANSVSGRRCQCHRRMSIHIAA